MMPQDFQSHVPAIGWRSTMIATACLVLATPDLRAQDSLPFGVGERLTYHVRVDKMRASGRGTMWIEGPIEFRGTSTLLLRSAVEVGIGPIKAINHTDSWLDASRMTSLRFEQRHRYLWSRRNSDVDVYPEEMRWAGSKGDSGVSLSDTPLDELSFIYYIRTLALEPDNAWSLNRHFDAVRNPVCIRVLGRETLSTVLGETAVVVTELRVKDPRFTGEGVIRLFMTENSDRVPVRIESSLPGMGSAVFTLESFVRAPARSAVMPR
jgi:hypothetical protein